MTAAANALAPMVRALGRGPGRSRHLTREEAVAAMRAMLAGDAAPEAVGALLMLLRFRGENADEIAGFVDALQAETSEWASVGAAIDWPSYAAGRSRGTPWFLLAAKLVARAGAPVLLHGWNAATTGESDVRARLAEAGISFVATPAAARAALARNGVAYAPLEHLAPKAYRLLRLRDVLGLRSPINTALRAFNPACADASLQGVFHPSYRGLQQDVAMRLGRSRVLALKGGGGEFERHPAKSVELFGFADGKSFEATAPARVAAHVRLADVPAVDLGALWRGELEDPLAAEIVCGAAAAALFGAGLAHDMAEADAAADALWRRRQAVRAA